MTDDLKPHQRRVELPWQARVAGHLRAIEGKNITNLKREAISLHTMDGSTRTERRLAMKAARKQKHGGKR